MENVIGWIIFAGLALLLIIRVITGLHKKLKKPKKSLSEALKNQLNTPKEEKQESYYNTFQGLFKVNDKKEDKMEESEDEEDEDEENTYSYDFTCDNCQEAVSWDIPVGTRAIDFIKKAKCETCECLTFDEEAKKFNEDQSEEE